MRIALATTALLALAIALGLVLGHGSLADPAVRGVFLELRALRMVNAGLAGAALAVAGVLMQGLFRNPLASPSVLGTSAGAALGGQLSLLLHGAVAASAPAWLAPEMLLPLGCFAGAALSLMILLLVIGRVLRSGGDALVAVLLAGFLLASGFAALGALATWLGQSSWEIGRTLVAFILGGVDGKGPRHIALALPLVAIGIAAAWAWGRHLDALLAGEEEAAALGVDVRDARRWILVWTAVLTAAATAIGGGVAFVGLIVPHALRPFTGVAHRRLIPVAALGGAAFLILCDALCRVAPGGELPLGVVTGLLGAPLFLALVLRLHRA
jgi:iron complex transport system permease protein